MSGVPAIAHPFPDNFKQLLITRHTINKKIRSFFTDAGYVEVETPCRVKCPGIDPYIDAIPAGSGFYLSTSPELQMKRLLALGIPRIYQITHAFRSNEHGSLHNSEFTMLEWYRTGTDYCGIMEETEQLLIYLMERDSENQVIPLINKIPFQRISVDELFREQAGWEPSKTWDEDRFFLDWVDKIDPYLATLQVTFVYDFPASLSSLSKLKNNNPQVCERFELFIRGLEIANAFTELTDPQEQEARFKKALAKRHMMKKEEYTIDEKFLDALRSGIPACSGVALGIDRLMMALYGYAEIGMVQAFPEARL
jgi:lysyl-tRNA synthetase class 2